MAEYYENLFDVTDKNIKMIGESTPAYTNNLSCIIELKNIILIVKLYYVLESLFKEHILIGICGINTH